MARVIRQSRINHSCDCFLLLQPCGNLFCILLGAFHADAKCLHAAQYQPAVKRSKACTCCLDQETQFFLNIFAVRHDKACQCIVVTTQVFRAAVNHNVRTEIERILKIRGHKGVVHNQNQVVAFCNIRHLSDVGYVHHRVRRSFDVDCFCIFFHIALHVITAAVDAGKLDAVFLVDVVEQTNAAAVQIGVRNDVVALAEHFHQKRDRCHAGA